METTKMFDYMSIGSPEHNDHIYLWCQHELCVNDDDLSLVFIWPEKTEATLAEIHEKATQHETLRHPKEET